MPFWSEEGIGDDWQPSVDWGLITTPQINGRRYHYAQGKALGGSSARNQMVLPPIQNEFGYSLTESSQMYHWPTKGSMDAWAEQVGDQSYAWENMDKYLRRSMHLVPNSHREKDHGTTSDIVPGDGPLQVTFPSYVNPLSSYGPEAFSSIGLPNRTSLTNGTLDGFGLWYFTMDPTTGVRSSAESSFLAGA